MPTKVVIVGGGCAGVAAAWELSRPGSNCEVTLYQEGWRLGGKGASGRGVHGRIEEHGLHLWLGYYENAFRLAREAYAYLAERGVSIPAFGEVFEPLERVGVFGGREGGRPEWIATFPAESGEPGDGTPLVPLNRTDWMGPRIARLLLHLVASLGPEGADIGDGRLGEVLGLLGDAVQSPGSQAPGDTQILGRCVAVRELLRPLLPLLAGGGGQLRRLAEVVDVVLASTIGLFQARLEGDWYATLNLMDFREWLSNQGLILRSSTSCPLLTALYNLAFAYEDGDPGRPRIAAGVGLECAIRTFLTYKRAPFWRMNTGMGDALFAPAYLALTDRGVDVKFFHRLRNVAFAELPARDDAGKVLTPGRVESLVFDQQAATAGGRPYAPLAAVNGRPCWPAAPLLDQLEGVSPGQMPNYEDPDSHTSVATVTLSAGEHFDRVILAVGAASLPEVAGDLVRRDPKWARMAAAGRTVATHSLQLWLKTPVEALGWERGATAITGLAPGFETWADMSHLADAEAWPIKPPGIVYLCGTVRETPGGDLRQQARDDLATLFSSELRRVIPGAFDAEGFRMGLLAEGELPGVSQAGSYRVLNARGSARYSQSPPGSIQARISPFDRSVANLALAGDYTDCGLNVGCVEAAVSSGIMAAAAVSGRIELDRLYGHGHVRPWFSHAGTANPPIQPSGQEDPLVEHYAALEAAVDTELDDFNEQLFEAALRATAPWRSQLFTSDSVPTLQLRLVRDEPTVIATGIVTGSGQPPGSFEAAWVPGSAEPGTLELRADSLGRLELEIGPLAPSRGLAVHHVLIRGPNGQAALLVELSDPGT